MRTFTSPGIFTRRRDVPVGVPLDLSTPVAWHSQMVEIKKEFKKKGI